MQSRSRSRSRSRSGSRSRSRSSVARTDRYVHVSEHDVSTNSRAAPPSKVTSTGLELSLGRPEGMQALKWSPYPSIHRLHPSQRASANGKGHLNLLRTPAWRISGSVMHSLVARAALKKHEAPGPD